MHHQIKFNVCMHAFAYVWVDTARHSLDTGMVFVCGHACVPMHILWSFGM